MNDKQKIEPVDYDPDLENAILDYLRSIQLDQEFPDYVSGHFVLLNGYGIYVVLENRKNLKNKYVGWFFGSKDENTKINDQFKYIGKSNEYHLWENIDDFKAEEK